MWYHISDNYLGEIVIFKPRVPRTAAIKEEGDIPRICVSDSLYYCVKSLAGKTYDDYVKYFLDKRYKKYILIRNPAVYCCEQQPYLPPKASDFRENNEHWYITPVEFKFLGFLDSRILLKYGKFKICSELSQKLLTKDLRCGNIHKTTKVDVVSGEVS